MISLRRRLLLATAITLILFLGATGLALTAAYKQSADAKLYQSLRNEIYTLLAAADVDGAGHLSMPDHLPEKRFSDPLSGLYGWILNDRARVIWRSDTVLLEALQAPAPVLKTGTSQRQTLRLQGKDLQVYAYGVAWENAQDREFNFTFIVADDTRNLHAEIRAFSTTLWLWLAIASAGLLAIQLLVLRWGLLPLHQAAREIGEIRDGRRHVLQGPYPRELEVLTDSINELIRNEQAQMRRYRDALADLAHSLKTPLAVLRNAADATSPDIPALLHEQVGRMDQIVEYQLKRAATAGRTTLLPGVAVAGAVTKLQASLAKVYAHKQVELKMHIPEQLVFPGEEGDLLEILGNLLDNAYKWCDSAVFINAQGWQQHLSVLEVGDDGPGFAQAQREQVIERGKRFDERIPGHGIGLAVVDEIVQAYGAKLELRDAGSGGALVRIIFDQPETT
jgi:two-component system sensor histidine kinase PhoQ